MILDFRFLILDYRDCFSSKIKNQKSKILHERESRL